MTTELFNCLEEFTCHMYVSQIGICEVNAMRYHDFRMKNGNSDSGQLSPCKNKSPNAICRVSEQAIKQQYGIAPDKLILMCQGLLNAMVYITVYIDK